MSCPDENRLAEYVEGNVSPDVRENIDVHLDVCPDCRSLVAVLIDASSPPPALPTPDDLTPEHPAGLVIPQAPAKHSPPILPRGTIVGRYLITETIGAGGMGVVYRAYDPDLDRRIAIKLVRWDRSASAGQTRLQREARVMARLNHPHVLPIYDVGIFEGQTFIAMEWIDGCTLSQWMNQDKRSLPDILRVFRAAGEGLAAAHDAGLVHRDFKPDNVLVGRDGRVRVMDFGLARVQWQHMLENDDDPSPRLVASQESTLAGALVGTPAYMAPEQHDRLPADARTDQFAFCVALYEATFGRRPFQGGDLAALSAATRRGYERDEIPAGRSLPPAVENVLRRGLCANPADRFPSMHVLLEDLRQAEAPPSSKWKWWSALALVFFLGNGLIWSSTRHDPATACARGASGWAEVWRPEVRTSTRTKLQAVLGASADTTWTHLTRAFDERAIQWEAAYRRACATTHEEGTQSSVSLEAQLSCLAQRKTEMTTLLEEIDKGERATGNNLIEAISSFPPIADCLRSGGLTTRGPALPPTNVMHQVDDVRQRLARARTLEALGQHQNALDIAREATEAAQKIDYVPLRAEAHLTLARSQRALVQVKPAEQSLREAIFLGTEAHHDEIVTDAWLDWIEVISIQDQPDTPEKTDETIRHAETWVRRLGHDPHRWALLQRQRAEALFQLRHFDRALPLAEEALTTLEAFHGTDHPETARCLGNLGAILMKLQRREEGARAFLRALEMNERLHGPEHPKVAMALTNHARALQENPANLAEAERLHARALEIQIKATGADHPLVAVMQHNLGLVRLQQDRAAKSVAPMQEAVRLYGSALGEHHQRTMTSRDLLVMALALSNRTNEAWEMSKINVMHCDGKPERLGWLVRSLQFAAHVALVRGDWVELERLARQSIVEAGKLSPPGDDWPKRTLLGVALFHQNKPADASKELEAVHDRWSKVFTWQERHFVVPGRYAMAQLWWTQPSRRKDAITMARQALLEAPETWESLAPLRREIRVWLDARERGAP